MSVKVGNVSKEQTNSIDATRFRKVSTSFLTVDPSSGQASFIDVAIEGETISRDEEVRPSEPDQAALPNPSQFASRPFLTGLNIPSPDGRSPLKMSHRSSRTPRASQKV